MKANILTHSIAALLVAAPFVHADEKKDVNKSANTSTSTAVVTSGDGTATVTIEVNGKKETRTFKLGDGANSFSFSTDDGATASGTVSGGTMVAKAGPMKKEKGPWIGIAMEPVQEVVRAQLSLAPGEGVVVNHVVSDSPAAKAGLEANDILLRFEDQIIVEPSQLQKLIAMKKPGDTVKLTYLRKGERKEADVTLVEHELEPQGPMQWLHSMPGWQGGRPDAPAGRLQEQLKQLKEKHPGIVVDRWSWSNGLDGAGAWNRERFKGMIDELGKQLENSNLPKEEQEKIRKNVEEAMESTRKAVEDAMKGVRRWRKDDDRQKDEPPKKPGEPL